MEPDALLWQDVDPKKDIGQKIADAVKRFREKRGREPTECWVNDKLNVPGEWAGVRIVKKKYILPYHFQVGVTP